MAAGTTLQKIVCTYVARYMMVLINAKYFELLILSAFCFLERRYLRFAPEKKIPEKSIEVGIYLFQTSIINELEQHKPTLFQKPFPTENLRNII